NKSDSASIGLKSSFHFSFLILMIPFWVNSIPFLAFLLGITQSNISIPNAMFSKRFTGVPTPIRYLGLSCGKILVTTSVIAYISSAGSPTERPPIAFPSLLKEAMVSADFSRRALDRKSTRLNSSHVKISYAVFCLKKKKRAYGRHHMVLKPQHPS